MIGMKNKWTGRANCRDYANRGWSVGTLLTLAIVMLTPIMATAYTAAGDRNFPATLILPQIAPTDALWLPVSYQPMANANQTQFIPTFSKMITEQLGVQFEGGLRVLTKDR
jgi:hypothetical protein